MSYVPTWHETEQLRLQANPLLALLHLSRLFFLLLFFLFFVLKCAPDFKEHCVFPAARSALEVVDSDDCRIPLHYEPRNVRRMCMSVTEDVPQAFASPITPSLFCACVRASGLCVQASLIVSPSLGPSLLPPHCHKHLLLSPASSSFSFSLLLPCAAAGSVERLEPG